MSYKSITDFIKPTIITAQQYGTKAWYELPAGAIAILFVPASESAAVG